MRVRLSINDEVVLDTVPQSETIDKKEFQPKREKYNGFKVRLTNGDDVTTYDICNDEITTESHYSTADPSEEEIANSEIPWKGNEEDKKEEPKLEDKVEESIDPIDIDESLIEQPDEGGNDDESNIASVEYLNDNKTEENRVEESTKVEEPKEETVVEKKKEDIIIKKSSSKPARDSKGKFVKRSTNVDDDNINVKSKFIPTEG